MKRYFLMAAALVLGFTACTPDGPEKVTPELAVDATEITAITADAFSSKFNVTANTTWFAEADVDWIIIDPSTGNANALVTVEIEANDTYEDRTATITVSMDGTESKTIAVSQAAAKGCNISQNTFAVGAEGGEVVVDVTANVGYTVTIAEECKEWISQVEATRAMETKTLTFAVAANEGYEAREGKITVSSELGEDVITITQSEAGLVAVSKEVEPVAAEGGEIAINVRHNMEYSVAIEEGCDWITRPATRAVVDTEERFVVAANEAAESRTATITFASELGEDVITVTQLGNTNAVVTIPDARFSKFIMGRYDANGDEQLTVAELQAITSLELWGYGAANMKINALRIADLTGIEYMTNLEYLDARGLTSLTAADFSKNTKLAHLDLSNSALASIDVSALSELAYLNLGGTKVSALDVTKNAKLEKLYIGGTTISEIDLSASAALRVLNASYAALAKVELAGCTALEQVYVNGNKLTEINTEALANLRVLNVEVNNITALDVTKNTKLEYLNAGRNALTSINAAGLSNLKNLTVSNNDALAELSLSGLTALENLWAGWTALTSVDIAANTNLATIAVNDTKVTALNTAANSEKLRGVRIDNSAVTTYDMSANSNLAYIFADGNPQMTTFKVWDEFNQLTPPANIFKDETTAWEGGYMPEGATGINLSEKGNANCYIVNKPFTKYYFDGSVKGNGVEQTIYTARDSQDASWKFAKGQEGENITNLSITPDRAEVLWFSAWSPGYLQYTTTCPIDPNSVTIFSDYSIEFETVEPFVNGNVVIAAYQGDEIVWSWHIWCCEDYDPETTKKKLGTTDTGYVMDRNIGAGLETADGAVDTWAGAAAVGMFYQWGRKDPFTGPLDIDAADGHRGGVGLGAMDKNGNLMYGSNAGGDAYVKIVNEYTIGLASVLSSPWTHYDAVEVSVANPQYLIHNNKPGGLSGGQSYAYEWWGDRANDMNFFHLWGHPYWKGECAKTQKTIYDPCPAGWMVPSYDYTEAIEAGTLEATGLGWNVTAASGDVIHFPRTGVRWANNPQVQDVTKVGTMWTNMAGDKGVASYAFTNEESGATFFAVGANEKPTVESAQVIKWSVCPRAVRCVQENYK